MKRLVFLILILILCSISYGANDFSGDANCEALWRFESGALTADSKGGNTLTQGNTPVADAGDFQEGAASCDFEADDSDSFWIADGDLDAGFPLKNGDSNKKISVCFWHKPETTVHAYASIINKADNSNNQFECNISSTGVFNFFVGTGAGWEFLPFGTAADDGKWYHVACTYDNSDKSYRIRVWDDNASAQLGADLTGTATNNINAGTGTVRFMSNTIPSVSDGKLDEVVVFNDILSAAEIDQIRAGTYAEGASSAQVIIIDEN